MAESIENKRSHVSGGVNTSNNATFKLCDLKSNLMFLLRKIKEYCYSFVVTNKSLCHPEFSSGSQGYEMLPHEGQAHKAHTSPVHFVKQVQHDNKLYLTFRKAFAFTLAETLIVMGIIGVVAALTIPNLNSSTADKEKVAKVKKIYSNLNDALGRAQVVYGPVEEWKQLDSTAVAQTARFGERLTEFMKVSKNCKMEVNKGCLSSTKVKSIGAVEDKNYDGDNSVYKFITADGTSIYFTSNGAFVDIDGPIKGSTQYGKDIFLFQLADNDFVPMRKNEFSSYLAELTAGSGFSASGWIIDYDNMDYLKLTKDQKCPNGKTPTEQNPRCK